MIVPAQALCSTPADHDTMHFFSQGSHQKQADTMTCSHEFQSPATFPTAKSTIQKANCMAPPATLHHELEQEFWRWWWATTLSRWDFVGTMLSGPVFILAIPLVVRFLQVRLGEFAVVNEQRRNTWRPPL